MSNPILDILEKRNTQATTPNNSNMFTEFQRFKADILKSGRNPKEMVMEKLRTGQMTDEQFKQLSQQATDFMKMFGGR